MSTLAILLLKAYKRWLSPMLPSACRFYPTCSEYMIQAIELYGLLKGFGMGIRRLGRCHPGYPGGYDPVPPPEDSGANTGNSASSE